MSSTSEEKTGELKTGWRKDARVIALVATAHVVRHVHLMLLPPLFGPVREAFGVSYLEIGAALTALAQSQAFHATSTLLEEAAALTGPAGFADLIMIARRGALADATRLLGIIEDYWSGLGKWIEALNLDLAPFRRADF